MPAAARPAPARVGPHAAPDEEGLRRLLDQHAEAVGHRGAGCAGLRHERRLAAVEHVVGEAAGREHGRRQRQRGVGQAGRGGVDDEVEDCARPAPRSRRPRRGMRRRAAPALSAVRLARKSAAGCCSSSGRITPRAAPPAPRSRMRRPAMVAPRLCVMSRTRPTPSVLSPWIAPPAKLRVFTAPAASARGVSAVARRKASSLKGTVTLAPRPPRRDEGAHRPAKPSSGARIAS